MNPLSNKFDKVIKSPQVSFKLRPEVLLCPNIPKPMHQVAPREVLGQAWWNKTRNAAYKSTDYPCIACGVHKQFAKSRQWMEGHELYDIDYLCGTMTYVETVPLCHYCHNYIHDGRLRELLAKGQVHHAKFVAIITHGDEILHKAGLERPAPYNGPIAEWSAWRLVLFGKQYPPKFKSEIEWALAHS